MSNLVKVHAVVEGHTEREFINRVVAPHLYAYGVQIIPYLRGNPAKSQKPGVGNWDSASFAILRHMKTGAHVTTLFDYYGMPGEWPGRTEAAAVAHDSMCGILEWKMTERITQQGGDEFNPDKFIPCIALHEFETLLFVAPEDTERAIIKIPTVSGLPPGRIRSALEKALHEVGGVAEAVNDSPETAPSKRIKKLVPGYDKVAWGHHITSEIGLAKLRAGCRWLDQWLSRMEALNPAASPF